MGSVRQHAGLGQHAIVRCGADDRSSLEQMCRSITRPAERLRGYQSAPPLPMTASRQPFVQIVPLQWVGS